MDVDPLSITTPAARYAIESDSEDEVPTFQSKPSTSTSSVPPPISFKYVGNDISKGLPLVVATGEAAKVWARGAGLGEQVGGICEEDSGEQLAFVFQKGEATVLVSEVTSKLSISSLSPYASFILESFQPSEIRMLDTYDTPSYISSTTNSMSLDHPIRYLSTSSSSSETKDKFESPNMIMGTPAALLSLSAFLSPGMSASVVLLPSAFENEWSTREMQDAHRSLFPDVEEWKQAGHGGELQNEKRRKGHTDIGEGGMYI